MNVGCIYVVAFDRGTVKIGKTQNVARRLGQHKSDAKKWGHRVAGEWASPPHAEWEENETALKRIARSLGGAALSAEYFSGVDFAAVVKKAQELTFTPPEADEEKPAEPDGLWAALKDRLASRASHAQAAIAKQGKEDQPLLAFYFAALSDTQRLMAQMEAEYPEPAST